MSSTDYDSLRDPETRDYLLRGLATVMPCHNYTKHNQPVRCCCSCCCLCSSIVASRHSLEVAFTLESDARALSIIGNQFASTDGLIRDDQE